MHQQRGAAFLAAMPRLLFARIAAPLLAATMASALPAQVAIDQQDGGGQIVRLSPDQREAALEAGAARADRDLPINGLPRAVHGEVGTEFGSNGSRAFYGTAAVPLGDTGGASFSFFNGDSGRYRPR